MKGRVVTGLAVLSLVLLAAAPADAGPYGPTLITVGASDGTGHFRTPGRGCEDGGPGAGAGAYWHYDYGAPIARGAFSQLPTTARVHVDLHHDGGPAAFLQGEESHAALLNERGTVKLLLQSGTCAAPTLAFDGSEFKGSGTWRVDRGAGSYRGVTGTGTFTVRRGEVNPGADNALDLDLDGTFSLPDPALDVKVVKTFWGGLGTDYLTRRVSVTYRITNVGAGDAFGARLTATASSTAGVTPLGPTPQGLFDMPADDDLAEPPDHSRLVTVRYQLGLTGPCALVLLGCPFVTSLTVSMPDALDVAHTFTKTVTVTAPILPPPL